MPTGPARRLCAAFALLCVISAAPAALQQQIQSIVTSRSYTAEHVSVAVRDCTSGQLVVNINADTQRTPASNMKVLTTGTAALVLGEDFRFETRLLRRGDNLILVGDGDPALADPRLLADMDDLEPEALLDTLASAAVDAGITSIDTLIVDDRVFDREATPPEWPASQFEKRHSAPVSGLNFHRNTVFITAKGRKSDVHVPAMSPPYPSVRLVNSITLDRAKKSSAALAPTRELASNRIVLRGKVSPGKTASIEISIDRPALRTGQLLAALLNHRGITVSNVRLARDTDPPAAGTPIGPPIVTTLETVLAVCNNYSNNLYAESLLKRLAHATTKRPGTRVDGGRIVTRMVQQMTGATDGLHVEDGSGLSQGNRVTTRLLANWMCAFDGDTGAEQIFLDSLAQPGTGTLKKRLSQAASTGSLVQAKSGYINRVSALTGLVTQPNGRRLAFSIIINNTDRTRPAKAMQDAIVAVLAGAPSSRK